MEQNKNLLDDIHKSFSVQAAGFESEKMSFSKQDYLRHTVEEMHLQPTDRVLEAAAGTCACGRSIAPYVAEVTCLDTTEAMLNIGRTEAQKAGLTNMHFVDGLVEDIPFAKETFDIVLSRLAFHHFAGIEKPFAEMARVLKTGGKLVVIDMEAAEEALREREDELERLRDFSHVKNRSAAEFLALYEKHGFTVIKEESTKISVSLDAWLDLTKTAETERQIITKALLEEIQGGEKTGFAPYLEDGKIYFWQRWILFIGIK